jgi:hypothetical protein
MHRAVDLGRVIFRASLGAVGAGLVDDDGQPLADLGLEDFGADRLLRLHEALPAALLNLGRHEGEAQLVGRRAFHRLVFERADAVELRFFQPVEQQFEILFGLAGEADDEGRADGEIGAAGAPGLDAVERLVLIARPLHRLQHVRAGVLEGMSR